MDGILVVELAGGLAGAWCGRLLSHLGAEVILVEPPAGSALRTRQPTLKQGESVWHHWLNGNKSSVVAADSAAAEEWAARADCVIHTSTGDEPDEGVADLAARLRADRPAQVFASLSPHGLTGPWRSHASSDLTEWAAGGQLYLTGDPDRPPVQGGGPWPGYFTGSAATYAIQTALFQAGLTGQGQLIDAGAMEVMAASHQWTISAYTQAGYVKRRDGNRLAESYHPLGIYRCSDGWVQLAASSNLAWESVCILAGCVELLADDALLTPAGRYDHADEIDRAIEPWFLTQSAADAIAALQGIRVPASVVNDLHGILSDEQLAARRFWSPVPDLGPAARVPGPPFMIGERLPAPPVHAPSLGSGSRKIDATARRSPATLPNLDLSAVRVLEFSVAWAGPLAGRCLADLGADVIKIEHPTSRGLGVIPGGASEGWEWGQLPPASVRNGTWPSTDPGERWFNRMAMFNKLQRNKRSLCLDVKAPGGDEVLRRLVEQSDIVLNNYSPRGVASLGIDHDSLAAINPSIITVSMSGYGATGPMSTHYSLGPILETHAGLASTTGYPEGGPLRIGVAFPDPVAGLNGTVATLAALWERHRTGIGQHVDLSQLETVLPLIGDHILSASLTGDLPERLGNRSTSYAPQGVYRCGGRDQWLALTIRSDAEWRDLAELIGSAALRPSSYATFAGRQAHHDVIDEAIEAWTMMSGKFEVMARLQARGLAAMAVMTNADLVDGSQLQARDFIATIESADTGPQRLPGNPIHFSDRTVPLGPAPTLGEHNHDVVVGLLGYEEAEINRLVDAGTLAQAPPD